MNFDDAIRAHSAWKTRLSAYLRNPDGSLHGADVCADNRCELGKWLVSAPPAVSVTPEFRMLKLSHTAFHKAAGAVVDLANSGKPTSEMTALGGSSAFATSSREVVQHIMTIKKKVAA